MPLPGVRGWRQEKAAIWYTSDQLTTLEYLETFRADRVLTAVH